MTANAADQAIQDTERICLVPAPPFADDSRTFPVATGSYRVDVKRT